MQKEKLIIKNFGPIKSVELELGRFNILIGEQATGKSTVAKVLAVCRYFSYIYIADLFDSFDGPFVKGLEAWGLLESVTKKSEIYYECIDYSVTVKYTSKQVEVSRSKKSDELGNPVIINTQEEHYLFEPFVVPKSIEFEKLVREFDKIKPDLSKTNIVYIPTSFYLNDVKNVLDNPFYLPTQRGLQSIFDIGQNSIRNLSSALFNQLSKMDGIARQFKQETYIEPLDIYYVNRDGHGFIRKANETNWYSLYNAASGYQSMIPIVLAVKHYEQRKRKKTFLVEEAEQNLFPSAQNKLMQYLVEHINGSGSSLFVTTQSPYVLASINNFIYAYNVGVEHESVNKVIDKKYWLNPDLVSAYRMLSDGTCKNIIDEELREIIVDEIDEVSKNIINKDYDRILDIKFGVDDAA